MMYVLYVAYGSNMNLEQMKYRCPNSEIIGNGKIIGWKLVFNVHADIIRTNKEEDEVPVVLWNIHDNDWRMLDRYEGYPNYYVKRMIDVIDDKGMITKAIVYVMTNGRKGICQPSKHYFDVILTGYEENGINTDTLYEALKYSIYNPTEYNQYNTKGE